MSSIYHQRRIDGSDFSLPLPISLSLHSSSSSLASNSNKMGAANYNREVYQGPYPSNVTDHFWRNDSNSNNFSSVRRRAPNHSINNSKTVQYQQSRYFPHLTTRPPQPPSHSQQTNVRFGGEVESDPGVLSRRQKQITYGKNTKEYQNYIQCVPIEKRGPSHPRTPPITRKFSRRAFDGLVKQWRLSLHCWSIPEDQHNFGNSFMAYKHGKEEDDEIIPSDLVSLTSTQDQHNESFSSEKSTTTTSSMDTESRFGGFCRVNFSSSSTSMNRPSKNSFDIFTSGTNVVNASNMQLSLSTNDLDKSYSQVGNSQFFSRPSSSLSLHDGFRFAQHKESQQPNRYLH